MITRWLETPSLIGAIEELGFRVHFSRCKRQRRQSTSNE